MGCSACAARAAQQNQLRAQRQNPLVPTECDFTKVLLQNWYNILNCVKSGNLGKINLTLLQANSYLGYLQSALNYPDNYCYYNKQLTEFQQSVLPRIVANVPECIN